VPRAGIVLGTGLGSLADALAIETAVPYEDIPHFPVAGVESHTGDLVFGRLGSQPVVVMRGRVHYYEGYTMKQVTFPVRVLRALGADTLLLTSATGGLHPLFRLGDLVAVVDHVNLMGDNPLIGPNDESLGPRFPDMSEPYDRGLRDVAEAACRAASIRCRRGVYAALTGPSYETPAEIRMFRTLGADAVGMSTVPEVIAARHMGMRVVGLSCLTNMAAGVTDRKLDHREVLETGERVKAALLEVLARMVTGAASER
jgi:purine-nucleoside phosphorylase